MTIKKETPLMKQYKQIKSENKDSILFFRLGDFYEMFFEDAKIVSKELGLTLTSRNREKGIQVPLAGVPYHSAAQYINKLVNKGYKVAMCEQVEDPKIAKGIVKREVVKIITPGTIIDIDSMDGTSNNYLLGLKIDKEVSALAYIDITTGEFTTSQFDEKDFKDKLINEMYKIAPNEIVMDNVTAEILVEELKIFERLNTVSINEYQAEEKSEEFLKEYFGVVSLESYGIENKKESIKVSALVLEYVLELQKYSEIPVNKINYSNTKEYMELNLATQRNLELTKNEKDKTKIGTLLWVLDYTKTSMGARLLKKVIKNPLINITEIQKRQENVKYFIDKIIIREEIKEELKDIYDLERLIAKIILGTENGRDLIAIKKSISSIMRILELLENENIFNANFDKLKNIYNKIDEAIVEEPPFSIREGKIIKRGFNRELDEIFEISTQGKDYIVSLEKTEKEKTGIKSLKVGYNKIFGYYLEITKKNVDLVPDNYIRKQTLANAERYITPELKEYETKILNAKDKIEDLEYKLFKELSHELKKETKFLQKLADGISYLDLIISFAEVAVKNNYIKPEITEGYEIEITEGRHPIVEKLIGIEEYIKNDIVLNEEEQIGMLTGPNMAGKSTYMKQIALIILMAQIGSYVPADSAKIGLVDKIFTRIGASDDLVSGQSTFMVEMSEVANIINSATQKSFIILDEVGRGTSTFDGISIAWAITEYIHDNIKAKTIFATHYHELTELEKELKNLINLRVEVKENRSRVIFLRKIVRGGADKSYGIEVAKLAGLPKYILNRSKKILKEMEKKKELIEKKIKGMQLSLFDPQEEIEVEEEMTFADEIVEEIENLEINNMTPLEAMNKLNELKKMVKNGGE